MPNDHLGELRRKIDSNDPFVTGGHQVLKPRSNDKKEVPEWTRDDKKVREILLRSFPKLTTDYKQRVRAARWIRIIHLYFRMHMTRGQVAEEMGVEPGIIRDVVRSIRRVAANRRANGSGVLGVRPRGRPKNRASI